MVPRVEGIHLRAGLIARGGLRWSERPRDFRTEVLDLAFAQVKKNAIIVPTGAKGGFVCRRPGAPGGTASYQPRGRRGLVRGVRASVARCHGQPGFRRGGHPARVVAWDGPDPYLVVAADKGTATFSDLANSLSDEYASGWATRSRPGDRAATTTRPWESRPGVPGLRYGAISASSASTCRPIPSGSRASATCPATCSATACCRAGPSGWWRPSTTVTSSWIPSRTRRRRLPSGAAWPRSPRRAGPTTVPISSPQGAGCGRATPRPSPSRRAGNGPWASRPTPSARPR